MLNLRLTGQGSVKNTPLRRNSSRKLGKSIVPRDEVLDTKGRHAKVSLSRKVER